MTKIEHHKQKRSFAEWVTFCIALLILAVIVSLVGYTWLNDENQPPILSVTEKQTIREIDGQFYVPFEVVNTGGDTAESVQIIAELQINGKVVETGEQQIDFLSRSETEEGAFVFSQNPSQGKLILRVSSYKLP
ncbi:TIGR02588 family protein [Nostocaceae cyanobacterium CENA357]|uniref:TIGR02588 family protein n=1 Tax=Atlanticothrix silvestris CENA357 TaxID=1725252 RepID=A0A8J7HJA5_9CYAN|nr:TIGR02588 family protein [Atlanticothrix silvestris]MBH8553626.1 TIGR02588 family protein [Atlanticothrix silvestris CENA357]